MKIFIVFLFLAISEAVAQSSDGQYTYTISATRTGQTIAPDYPVCYMYYQISPIQNMTYFVDIDESNPLDIEYYVSVEDDASEASDETINGCSDPGTSPWGSLVIKIVIGNLTPEGKCPVKKGNYNIQQKVEDFDVTFPDQINCGEYTVIANLYGGKPKKWALQVEYQFTIVDDCLAL